MIKRVFSCLIAAAAVLCSVCPAFAADKKTDYSYLAGTEINVYNWGEYICDGSEGSINVNKQFEKETGIKINYTTYDTNENMYNKIKGGGANYDIIIPSDYMIERMINEEMLEKINFDNIPNYKNIMDRYKGLYFDPNDEYSVPYNVGMVGLIYNTKMVSEIPDSWEIMWDEKYSGQILMFNNPRDAFAIAQLVEGVDFNTNSSEQWHRSYDRLKEQKPLIKAYVADEVFEKMEGSDAAIGAYYAGDFLSMYENNPDLAFVYPKEGTNIFVDSICIPVGCQNKTAAELYINFLLREDIALANAEYLYYATPNQAVFENPDYSLREEEILYPAEEDMPKTQYYHNLPEETLMLMTSLWDNLKIEDSGDTAGIYAGLITFTAVTLSYALFRFIRKKKREKMY